MSTDASDWSYHTIRLRELVRQVSAAATAGDYDGAQQLLRHMHEMRDALWRALSAARKRSADLGDRVEGKSSVLR